jgi:hypothetical protein
MIVHRLHTCGRALLLLSLVFAMGCGRERSSAGVLPHTILEKRDISLPGVKRFTYRVEIRTEEIPDAIQMRGIAQHLWRDGNRSWGDFTVFFYLPGMDSHGAAFGIAEFTPRGLSEFRKNDAALYGTRWRSVEKEAAVADSAWDAQKRGSTAREYQISLDVREISTRRLSVTVETDLPEGTNLLLTASRSFHERDNEETYAGDLLERDISVRHGPIQIEFVVNDTKWYEERLANERKFAGMGVFGQIGRISGVIEVEAMFSPRRNQTADVLRHLGPNGELIRGSGAQRVGDFTTLRATKEIEIPFQP